MYPKLHVYSIQELATFILAKTVTRLQDSLPQPSLVVCSFCPSIESIGCRRFKLLLLFAKRPLRQNKNLDLKLLFQLLLCCNFCFELKLNGAWSLFLFFPSFSRRRRWRCRRCRRWRCEGESNATIRSDNQRQVSSHCSTKKLLNAKQRRDFSPRSLFSWRNRWTVEQGSWGPYYLNSYA